MVWFKFQGKSFHIQEETDRWVDIGYSHKQNEPGELSIQFTKVAPRALHQKTGFELKKKDFTETNHVMIFICDEIDVPHTDMCLSEIMNFFLCFLFDEFASISKDFSSVLTLSQCKMIHESYFKDVFKWIPDFWKFLMLTGIWEKR